MLAAIMAGVEISGLPRGDQKGATGIGERL
jgi:hypothetical protein